MVGVVKMNYNFLAVAAGCLLVAALCLAELFVPTSVAAEAAAEEPRVELPVVMYHHMLKQGSRLGDYVISPAQFEEDLQYIQTCGYTPISVARLLKYYDEGAPLPQKPILLTFDDGNVSFYEYAYPLLQKCNMPAVVSVIGNQTELYSGGEPQNVNYSHMTWDMLREMRESGLVEIGNHTYDMHHHEPGGRLGIRILDGESPEDYRAALLGDVGMFSDRMEEELGVRPVIFAYPYGALCGESRPILREIGFRVILTCEERVNRLEPLGDDGILVLKRFNRPHKYSTSQFFKKLGVTPE